MLTNTADVDKALNDFQKSGMDVLRIWGFADFTGSQGQTTAFQVSLSGPQRIRKVELTK